MMAGEAPNLLGTYLRDRRTRLDPATFGFSGGRRRTPGLRREEVASRANISPTWYTWLEQGRGGAPSADVLDRIAKGLMLTEPEREHLYMLGLGRLPEARYQPVDGITPRLQRVLDAMTLSPAIIKTAMWDVVGWNRAAAVLLTDYAKLPREGRNILPGLHVDTLLSGRRVMRELTAIAERRELPCMVVSDNGTELTSHAVLAWCQDAGVEWHYIAPGKPQQNGFGDAFNGRLRDV